MSGQNPSDIHLAYLKAFNAGDIEATVACYESRGCYVSKSGRTAIGDAELREVYRVTFSNKPQMEFDIRKVIPAGDDLALIILGWTSKAVSAAGDTKSWSGVATDIVRKQPDGRWKLVLDNSSGIE
jgi:uncharacterized protein (TIGR02246 family)